MLGQGTRNLFNPFVFCSIQFVQSILFVQSICSGQDSIEVQRFVQSAFSMDNFFFKYFVRKNWRGGGELMNVIEK